MDSGPSLRLHLHSPHGRRSRPLVRPSSTPMDVPRPTDLQIDLLDLVLRHWHRNHGRAESYRLQLDLAILEIMASSWHVRFSSDYSCSSDLRLGGGTQVPQVWVPGGYVVREQDLPQRRRVGLQRSTRLMVFTRELARRQSMRCQRRAYLFYS